MFNVNVISNSRIAVIGLGYVGLPLAIEFAKKYNVLGFDVNEGRVKDLNLGIDRTNEANLDHLKIVVDLKKSGTREIGLCFSSEIDKLSDYDIFIVTVPTPIDKFKAPDLRPLLKASEMLGSIIKQGDLVIYESTVYPGCTEEDCVPVLELSSGLNLNEDFFVGYSPERINPGDKINTLTKIKKVTSGSTEKTAQKVDNLYRSIITAGTHRAPSIKVAEASKVIENAQRDINISFVNELSLIFDRMGIDTYDVLEAASTKWNFLKYQPGLVGGHCIGVDPYYLAYKAQSLGYQPNVILSGRRVNDKMGAFVAEKVVKLMIQKDHKIKGARALILGITFKENCPDVRNTRVADIFHALSDFGLLVDIYDPWASSEEVLDMYGLTTLTKLAADDSYDAIIVAVAHKEFLLLDFKKLKGDNGVLFDTKSFIDRSFTDARL